MPFDFLCCVKPNVEEVVELDYSNSSITDVPNEVFIHERTLEILYCQGNRISELPRQLFMCHGLKYLDLSDNELHAIPIAISSLVNLQHFNVNRNSLSLIPDTMKTLKYLSFLDLSVNPLEKLPDAITNLISLRELYLNDTYLEYLPGNFGRLANLHILELRDNYLMILPKSLSRSTDLERLDIGQNEFQQFPEVIGRFVKLKELWIDSNSLTEIPSLIKPLDNLIHLEASNNMIEELSSEIGYCSDMVELSLSSNSLTQLPESIGNLSKLTTLKLDNNRLFSLPDSIGSLSNLEELMLKGNYLENVPSSIGLLRKLQYLNLDENMLVAVPPELGSCDKLSVLSLRNNKLTKIPPELGHISCLKVLNLVRNSLNSLPQSLLNCDNLVAIWLSENQSKPLVPMHTEVDPKTYEQVLTCFLFPQVPLSPVESKSADTKTENTDQNTISRHISFVDMKATPKVPEKPGQLRRAPTPYPKELRALAKHARNIQKDDTQDVTPSVQSSVHIKAAKITPTLQQRFAFDNQKNVDEADNSNSLSTEPMKTSIYDNMQAENTYDKPLDLGYEQDKTYKSVDHELYPSNSKEDYSKPIDNIQKYDREEKCNLKNDEIYASKHDGLHGNTQKQNPQPYYSKNPNDKYEIKDHYRSNTNDLQTRLRLSVASQDQASNNGSMLEHQFDDSSTYGQMRYSANRLQYEPLRTNPAQPCHNHALSDGNYHDSVYSSHAYVQAKEKLYGQSHYDRSYHAYSNHDHPSQKIQTVSQVVGSSTMPNISNYNNLYSGPGDMTQHYTSALQNQHIYGTRNSPSMYHSCQSPELYSPTGHNNLTNPYRMTNTPLVSEDGSCNHTHTLSSQAMYDLYDATSASSNPSSVVNHQHMHSGSTLSEPIYSRQPPPYHIAAPYTKHAQYFNGTG